MKRCCRCKKTLPIDQFNKERRRKDGLAARCRGCVRELNRAWREANPDYSAESNRKWREANPEKYAAWYADNRARVAETGKAWREANAERKARANHEWRLANLDRRSASVRRWQKAHPEKAREISHRRRARRLAATVGDIDLDQLWADGEGACGICQKPIDRVLKYPDPMSRSLDHIVPLAKGGTHEQANLQWAHLVCNNRKGATSAPSPDALERGLK